MAELDRYRPWLYAAAAYNLVWGLAAIALPRPMLAVLGVEATQVVLWQVIGMFVLVYAPGYWCAARHPERHAHLVAIALAGKTLGAIGFAAAAATGALPLSFGLTVVTNDLVWLLPFGRFLQASARAAGGWHPLLAGRPPAGLSSGLRAE